MKKLLSLVLAVATLLCAIPILSIGITAADGVTLSSTDGADYSDLNAAIAATPNGGTITVTGTYNMTSGYNWKAHGKSVTITGGTFNAASVGTLNIRDSVTFKAIKLKWSGTVYANGNALRVDEDVTVTGKVNIYGGGRTTTVQSTSLTLLSGSYSSIYGGSYGGTVNGDTYLYVGGNVNADCDTSSHSNTHAIYGGGSGDTIKGDTHTVFGGNAKVSFIFGGSNNSGAKINGTAYLDITGGDIFSVYGAGNNVDCVKNTVTTITGGTFHQIFGGAQSVPVTGNVTLRIWDGTVTRRIYGGCYNNYDSGWKSYNGVSGTITLVIGSGLSLTYSASDSDKALSTRSRNNTIVDGSTVLYYSDASAKSTKNLTEKRSDFIGKLTLGDVKSADTTHNLSHKASGNVITETCSHCNHTATATLKLRDGASLDFTGGSLTPAFVEYSDNWVGEPLGEVTYKNNVSPGEATATAVFSREKLTATLGFNIAISNAGLIMAIADGRLSDSYTLTENVSFKGLTVTENALVSIVNAVNEGKIAMSGYALTDLSVDISSLAGLSAITEYTRGSFTLTKNIDMGGITLDAPLFTLYDSTLSGNRYSIFNYSTLDCGLMAVSGASSLSELRLGYSTNRIISVSVNSFSAPLCAEIPEGAALTVTELTTYVDANGKVGVGGIVGSSQGRLTIDSSAVYGSVVSETVSGGFVAEAETLNIKNSFNFAEVSGKIAGGFVGCQLGSAELLNIRNVGKITNVEGGEYAAALVGKAEGQASLTVENAVNIGLCGSATENSGALIGFCDSTSVTVKSSTNAGQSILNTDTPIVCGGTPILEGNYSLSMKNENEGVTLLPDLTAALEHLNKTGEGLMMSTDGSALVYGTPTVYGVQRSDVRTITKNGKTYDAFSVRFIVTINSTLDYSKLGLSIRVGTGEYINTDCEYVFTTLLATDNGGEQVEISAEDLGGAYVYAVTVNNVPLNGITANGGVSFSVIPYATDKAGNEYTGTEKSVTYVYGECIS